MAAPPPHRSRAELDAALLDAHEREDKRALVTLYAEAADLVERDGDTDAACFYLTHAYVFALQCGAPEAGALHTRLVAQGRDE
ncbi:MAG: hypothetical protein AAF666_18905 [Pseudomonadota bacterium]